MFDRTLHIIRLVKSLTILILFLQKVSTSYSNEIKPQGPLPTKHSFIEASYIRGLMLPHHNYLQFYNRDFINGFEIRFVKTFPEIRPHRPPGIGLGIYHSNLGNNDIYGNITGVCFSFHSTYLSITDGLSMGSTVSSGIAYSSKPFSKEFNPLNQAIGTHLNALIILSLDLKIRISNALSILMSPSLVHTSNGKIKLPNTGLNLQTFKIGAHLNFKDSEITPSPFIDLPVKTSRSRIIGLYAAGLRQSYKRNPVTEFVSSTIVEYTVSLSPYSRVGLGGNLFLSTSLTPELTPDQASRVNYAPTGGIHFSYEIVWDKLSFVLQPGVRVFNTLSEEVRYFTRIGLRYNIYKGIFINFSIKSNFLVAEYMEWGIGYNKKFLKR